MVIVTCKDCGTLMTLKRLCLPNEIVGNQVYICENSHIEFTHEVNKRYEETANEYSKEGIQL